jgi:acyl carrier protein phosphodiesterase
MNFLAHAYLAGPDPALRLGGMLGDFVKGPLPAGLPPAVATGVRLHRRIDSFAETHPAFCRSRARVSPLRRRYAGIMVDLFYDHFLARDWSAFAERPLAEFAADTYALLAAHAALLPAPLAAMFPSMRGHDWLTSYRAIEATGRALDRIGERRLRRANPLAGSIAELRAHYREFGDDFAAFIVDAEAFAANLRNGELGTAAGCAAGTDRQD